MIDYTEFCEIMQVGYFGMRAAQLSLRLTICIFRNAVVWRINSCFPPYQYWFVTTTPDDRSVTTGIIFRPYRSYNSFKYVLQYR